MARMDAAFDQLRPGERIDRGFPGGGRPLSEHLARAGEKAFHVASKTMKGAFYTTAFFIFVRGVADNPPRLPLLFP